MPPPRHTSHGAFLGLLHHEQVRRLSTEATYLAHRRTPVGWVQLYHFPAGFFAEVGFNVGACLITECRVFHSTGPLAAYSDLVRLPVDWLPNT